MNWTAMTVTYHDWNETWVFAAPAPAAATTTNRWVSRLWSDLVDSLTTNSFCLLLHRRFTCHLEWMNTWIRSACWNYASYWYECECLLLRFRFRKCGMSQTRIKSQCVQNRPHECHLARQHCGQQCSSQHNHTCVSLWGVSLCVISEFLNRATWI